MNNRFLELDSTYRNREQYPLPAEFTVLISQSGTKETMFALDPVSNAAVQKLWIPSVFQAYAGLILINPTNTPTDFIIHFPVASNVSKIYQYYNGAFIQVTTAGPVNTTVKITEWIYMSTSAGEDYFKIQVSSPGITGISTATNVVFQDGTDLNNALIYIPDGPGANNFYSDGFIIYNQTRNQWRPIISYESESKLAGLNISSVYGGPIVAPNPNPWVLTDTLSLRNTAPQEIGVLLGGSQLTATLAATSSNINNFYTGSFLRITSGANINLSRRITSYDGTTHIASLEKVFSTALMAGDTYEILQTSRDNAIPFTYSGSLVSQQEMVCYEVELLDLVLPNKLLKNGGRIAFYPYVYVELQNLSGASSGNVNILYSNNPNSTRKLFRCPIDDISDPLRAAFVKIDSDGAVQTIKFKPNDNLNFAVYLPNGEIFETVDEESYSPAPPNPFIQISVLFSIKRL